MRTHGQSYRPGEQPMQRKSEVHWRIVAVTVVRVLRPARLTGLANWVKQDWSKGTGESLNDLSGGGIFPPLFLMGLQALCKVVPYYPSDPSPHSGSHLSCAVGMPALLYRNVLWTSMLLGLCLP